MEMGEAAIRASCTLRRATSRSSWRARLWHRWPDDSARIGSTGNVSRRVPSARSAVPRPRPALQPRQRREGRRQPAACGLGDRQDEVAARSHVPCAHLDQIGGAGHGIELGQRGQDASVGCSRAAQGSPLRTWRCASKWLSFQRSVQRPRLHRRDRVSWVRLSRLYWRWKLRKRCGRPRLDTEICVLIRRTSRDNP